MVELLSDARRKISGLPGQIADRIGVSPLKRSIRDYVDFDMLRPRVKSDDAKHGETTIAVGKRNFVIRTMMLQSDDGRTDRVRVIAERAPETGKSGEMNGFHPLRADLARDTTVEFFKALNGEWGVFGKLPENASANWLHADAFDALNRGASSSGIVQIGTREFCQARILTVPDIVGLSGPLVIERVGGATPAEDRRCLLNADMSAGDTIGLAGSLSATDSFETAIVAQLEQRWRGSSGFEPVTAAAIHAFRAGMPAQDAIALAEQLALSARTELGANGPADYAAAGASAGLIRRAGYDQAAASSTAQAVVRMAESMRAPGQDHATVRQFDAIDHAYHEAAGNLAGLRDSVRTMDRSALGPDLTAINTAARELFIEKRPAGQIAAAAYAAAQRAVRSLRTNASRTEKSLRETESALAFAQADVAALLAEHPAAQHASRSTWWPFSLSGQRASAISEDAENPRLVAYKTRLDATRKKLRNVQRAYDDARENHLAATHQVSLVVDDDQRRLRCDVVVQALSDARNAAPDRQGAAMVAARAACETFGADGDQAMARHAAATAHLAALAGATEHDSLVAAHLFASRWGAGDREPATVRAQQIAYAQVARAGIPDDDARPAWTLAASAAAAFLNEHGADVKTAARLMGDAVTQVKPLAPRESLRNEALYRVIGSPSAPRSPSGQLPTFPAHYEAIESPHNPHTAALVDEWKHAKIRQVLNPGFHSESGLSTTTYIIELTGENGQYWTNFEWSPNANQLYGEVAIKPHGASVDDKAAHAKAVVAYNGVSGKWQSFEQRSNDMTVATIEALKKIEEIVTSRDDRLTLTRLPYSGKDSGHMQNLIEEYKLKAELQIRLFVQGRNSQPKFVDQMTSLYIELAGKLEGDRSRKKAIIRHQIDSFVRIASVLVGTSLGAARVAGTFH